MIIYPDNSIEIQSHRPNVNWTNRTDVIVVNDGSALAQKIEDYAPYFERVLDDKGNLIDITPIERPVEPPSELEKLKKDVADLHFALMMAGVI